MRFVYHDYQPIAIYIFINRLFCSLHFWKFTDTFADIIDVFLRKIAFAVKVGIFPAAGHTTVSWNPTVILDGAERYFYVQVTEQNEFDNDEGNTEQIAVSAPLWFKPIR